MIDDLDDVLRRFLIRELPVKNSEVDIKFEQPKREWSARLSRPTLNLFLYDIRENQRLRQTQPAWDVERQPDGTVSKRRKPVRTDLHYMITAWAAEPEDEHRLLSRTLMALFRFPHLPEELLPESFQTQPVPVALMAAQEQDLTNPADVWSALDNEFKPSIVCVITLALDPYRPITVPLVRTRDLRFYQQPLDELTVKEQFWTIGGTVRSERPLDGTPVNLKLIERDLEVPLQPDGRFAIGRLREGDYTLEITVEGRKPRRHKITVPSPDYELEV